MEYSRNLPAITLLLILSYSPLAFSVQVPYMIKNHYIYGAAEYSDSNFAIKSKPIDVYSSDSLDLLNRAGEIFEIEKELKTTTEQSIRDQLDGKMSLSNYRFSFSDSFVVDLIGMEDGNVKVSIGGFNISVTGKLRKGGWAEADLRVTSSTVWAHGDYNAFTGKITNISFSDLNVKTRVETGAIFDLLPGLFTNEIEEYIEDKLKSEIESRIHNALNAITNQEFSLLGLDQKIPTGIYHINGYDAGYELSNAIKEFFNGERLQVKIERISAPLKKLRFITIKFSERLTLNIYDYYTYFYREFDDRCNIVCPQLP